MSKILKKCVEVSKRKDNFSLGYFIEAKKIGLQRVLITCDTKNEASYAVIKKALKHYGGKKLPDIAFENTSNHRVWINTIDKDKIR